MQVQTIAVVTFNPTPFTVVSGFGGALAEDVANQAWGLTLDGYEAGTEDPPEGTFWGYASGGGDTGADARIYPCTYNGFGQFQILSVDPATGLAADAIGYLTVEIRRLAPTV